jgi:hypothetical protein
LRDRLVGEAGRMSQSANEDAFAGQVHGPQLNTA